MATATPTTLFSPTQITGCQLWFDAADSSTFTYSSGTSISQWRDKSSNAYSVIQPTTGRQPSLSSAIQNGLPGIQFATNTFLYQTATSMPNFTTGGSTSVLIAARNATVNTGWNIINTVWFNTGGGNENQRYHFSFNQASTNGTTLYTNGGLVGQVTSNAVPSSTNAILGFTASSTSQTIHTNGSVNTYAGATLPNAIGNTAFIFNDPRNNSGTSANILIFEMLGYNTQITTAQRQQLEGYLAWKWGMQGNLPVTHPYKQTPIYALPPFPLVPKVPYLTSLTTYNPTSIPNCVLWLDGADKSTMFTDSGGTIPITGSGQTVAFWRDKSTSANSATGATNQPTVSFSGPNNLPVLNFNGSQFLSLNPTLLPNGATPFTYFFLVRTTSSSVQVYYTQGTASAGQAVQFYYNNYLLVNDLYGSAGPSDTTPYNSVYVLMDTTASSIYTGYANGNPFGNGAVNISLNTGTTFAYIGCGQVSGTRTYYLIGQIAEVIAYNRVLRTTERQQVEAYLQWKWGFQSTIPSSNPYIISPPYQAPSFPLVPRVPAFTNKIFTPTSISGCSLWLDAADPSTVTLSGNTVTSVRDKSSLNVVLSNASGFTYPNNTFNGSKSSFFVNGGGQSGGGTQRLGVNSTYTLPTPFTVSFVCQHVGAANYGYILDSGPSGSGRPYILDGAPGPRFTPNFGIGGGLLTTSPLVNNFIFGPNSVAYQNGTQQFTGSITTLTTGGITVGNRFTLNESWPGHICEIIIHNTALTNFQRQQIEGYLAWKWGLQANLPGAHPYKFFPPSPV